MLFSFNVLTMLPDTAMVNRYTKARGAIGDLHVLCPSLKCEIQFYGKNLWSMPILASAGSSQPKFSELSQPFMYPLLPNEILFDDWSFNVFF